MNWKAILAGGLAVSALVIVGIAVAGGGPAIVMPAPTASTASASPSASAAAPTSAAASADPMSPATSTDTTIPAPAALQPSGQTVALPTSVSIPTLSVMSTLIPLGVNPDLTVQVPLLTSAGQAGWFDLGVRPGEIGSAVLLGHVNADGVTGVFNKLGTMNLGDIVSVGRADGTTVSFKVIRVHTVLKSQFPSQEVYGPKSDAEIQLITCGGTLDRAAHNYLSSVIVTGVLVS